MESLDHFLPCEGSGLMRYRSFVYLKLTGFNVLLKGPPLFDVFTFDPGTEKHL